MNPLTWGLFGWWLTQLGLLLTSGTETTWNESVAWGMVGLWFGVLLCGGIANRRQYPADGCVSFFMAWILVAVCICAAGGLLKLPGFVLGVASFAAGPLGLWLLGAGQMSPLVVLGLAGTATFYIAWEARVERLAWPTSCACELFLLVVLILQIGLARRARRVRAPETQLPPWLRR